MKYYIVINRQAQGPFDHHELLTNGLTPTSLVWCEGMTDWQQAQNVEELRDLLFGPEYADERAANTRPAVNSCTEAPLPRQCPPFPGQQPPFGQQQPPYGQQPYGQAPYGQAPYGQQAPMAFCPTTWLWQSIVVTLLCCLPLGVVGIVKASQVEGLWRQGHQAEAERASQAAKTWTLWSFGVGLGVQIIYWGFIVGVGVLGALA